MTNNLWDKKHQAFQDTVKNIRITSKKTQQELAEILGKPQSYVSKYESGERKLEYLEVREICHACNTSIQKFENQLSKLIEK